MSLTEALAGWSKEAGAADGGAEAGVRAEGPGGAPEGHGGEDRGRGDGREPAGQGEAKYTHLTNTQIKLFISFAENTRILNMNTMH